MAGGGGRHVFLHLEKPAVGHVLTLTESISDEWPVFSWLLSLSAGRFYKMLFLVTRYMIDTSINRF